MRNFKELIIWQEAMDVAVHAYDFCKHLPVEERYNLISQIQRAAVSIPVNIAEGCSRSSQKDFKRFIEIGIGSGYEVENLVILADRIYTDSVLPVSQFMDEIVSLDKRMTRFYQNIKI
ncbi:MAG: four helix bundle protein [Bacteroidia bacterium]